ncbi:MAG TPA: hypothetical protein VEK79_22315 [Thermoanaerobaculia bacterium]|nr:hypothetical protein [Thermoanaerobaculia bacterium]
MERTENPSDRRGSEQLRQAERGRNASMPKPTPTPTKAEGEVRDVEQALRNEQEK